MWGKLQLRKKKIMEPQGNRNQQPQGNRNQQPQGNRNQQQSLELCINVNDDDDAHSPGQSGQSDSTSTYDSMLQSLQEELNNQCSMMEFADFEDVSFFDMDCATAMSFDYDMNYTLKQLKHIAGYYGLKCRSRKADMIHDIVVYETDAANGDAVARRKRMFRYMDVLKSDDYLKSYVIM
jgi:hypothetical protein